MLETAGGAPLVLIADDDSAVRHVLSSTLAYEGFSVIEADTGAAAVALFEEARPDVVLMDVEMPGTDGYAACRAIRDLPGGAATPVVMVTGHDDCESIDRAFEAGATDFISKPINWSLIGHRLRYILRGASHVQSLAARESENGALVEAIPDAIFIVNRHGLILKHLSKNVSAGLYPDLSGTSVAEALPVGVGAEVVRRCMDKVLTTGEEAQIEYEMLEGDGVAVWYESRFVHHADDKVLVINRDVSEQKHAARRIHRLAYYDGLTGLPNRALFEERLEVSLEHAQETGKRLAVFDIDLNRFKRINDTLGTATGDAVLTKMAERLTEFVNGLDASTLTEQRDNCLACFGGDHFALALAGLSESFDVSLIAEQLRACIAAPLDINSYEFVLTASIGTAVCPEHGEQVETLQKNAESARDEAKRRGRNTQEVYRRSMRSGVGERLSLENELRRALENDELSVQYQPKCCTTTLEHRGAEALLRWRHAQRGFIPPSTFIPIAEESGLIGELGQWVTNAVCEQIASWQETGICLGPIAINISGQEFGQSDLVAMLADATSRAGIEPSALELEITESVLMRDVGSVKRALHELREAGFSLAVDDFGTGYSSLRYLQEFPVDVLKIDASFVRDAENNPDSRAICTAIIALARSLGLRVVGEGVEDDWQLKFLGRERCDIAQGFYLGKAVPALEFAQKLLEEASRTRHTVNQRIVQFSSRRARSGAALPKETHDIVQ